MSRVIILGDTHFGAKRFSLEFLDNQLRLFNEQLFPYMKENNITEIYQLGDLFDNRTTCDIIWLENVKKKFFDVLKENDFTLYTLLGNHDIALRESLDISLVQSMSQIYKNFKIFKEKTAIDLLGRKTLIVPWLVKGEVLSKEDLKDKEIVLGHFEIQNFSMVKGHIDTSSDLTTDFFKENKVDKVFSGHYHIKNTYGDIKYLGTPLQLNWNDFLEEKGFYAWDGEDLEFIENTVSKKHIKIKYNDEMKNHYEIEGFKNKIFTDFKDKDFSFLKGHEIKFFINKASTKEYEEVLYQMKEAGINPTIIDNQEISKLIGVDYKAQFEETQEEQPEIELENTRELTLNTVKNNREDLIPLLLDVLSEINTKEKS